VEDLRELYQEVILDHNRSPRNYGKPAHSTHHAEGDNPLCGDHLDVYLTIENDLIKDIAFEGKGCAISKASASLMTASLKGKTVEEAKALFEQFHELITKGEEDIPDFDVMGKLAVFAGVRSFPLRVKCASLAWHAVLSALNDENGTVATTE